MNKYCDLKLFFEWLVEDIRKLKDECDRTIIYCQTIKQCGIIYGMLRGLLRKDLFIEKTSTDEKLPLVEMLHSCTSASNKKNILTSFQHEDGIIRVLVATIAFSMGVISIAKLFTGSSIMGHQRILKPLFKKLGELGMMAIRLAHFCCIMACGGRH